ncbi:hypothetical protein [Acinetobacter bereziniae]|uniref:hypothetical protein n=1 Tax=Acinetobacter bereziniae TaxID=106648 RepID=UPI00190096B6|nr:hypothetical protein [Acinetobacter bereziniae]MBJ8426014.1 hypothetical protein [Acinetobacter bereziniae]MBJ9901978.1 hypothetical protein [Acinetobacter bereziniae]
MTSTAQKKTEFISNENNEFRMRLYSYEYIQKNGEIYRVSKSGVLYLIEAEEHAQKPWIREIFKRERKVQLFNQPCFKRTPYSPNQRIAYNNTKYN